MATSFLIPPGYRCPVGFRFRPTEEELITHYLKNKMLGDESLVRCVREIDLYSYEPWELPKKSFYESDNYEWFFFRAQSSKTRRITGTGSWKTTGGDRPIKARGTNKVIATRKILVFYSGRGENASKTNWVIHEYHLQQDTNFPLPPFVICRLKENDVSPCDQDEQNSRDASGMKKKVIKRGIEKIYTDTQTNEQPALTEFQAVNGYDGEVSRQSIQPTGASENEVNLTDATSKRCRLPSGFMDFQPANVNVGGVTNRLLQPEASESEFNLTEVLRSIFVEDDKCDEVTSKNFIDSSEEELVHSMVNELLNGGFNSNTANDAAFNWQNGHISPSYVSRSGHSPPRYVFQSGHVSPSWVHGSEVQNMPLRRSALSAKRFQFKEEKDVYRLDELQGNSSFLTGEGEARMCDISMDGDNYDPGPRTFKAEFQPKFSNVVSYGSEPKRDQLKREIQSKAISQDKAKEEEKHIVVHSPQGKTHSNNGLKSETGNKATKCGVSCCGSVKSTRNFFPYILITNCIHHKPSLPLVYVAKAFLGMVMFVMFAQEVLLYGHWC